MDNSEESRNFLTEGIELYIAQIETFVPDKNAFDFAFSCNTLFFLTPLQIVGIFQNVFSGLHSGGIFACNVLGNEDDWVAQGRKVSFFTQEDLKTLAADFDVLGIVETKSHRPVVNKDGSLDTKFWHQLNIVARKS